jgi:tetratricopeptide (TPR) repeat protein
MKVVLKVSIAFLVVSLQAFAQDKTLATYTKSLDLEKQGKIATAIDVMKTLNDTTSYHYMVRMGWLYYKLNAFPESEDYYTGAINLEPNAIEPRYGFGFPGYAAGNTKDLLMHDKKVLEIDPNHRTINANMGALLYYAKDYAGALPYLKKVVDMYPFDYDNNLLLGWTYFFLNKFPEAETHFNVVLLYAPTDASAQEGLGSIKKKTSNPENVTAAFTKSYELVELARTPDYKAAIEPLKEVYDKTSYFMNLRLGYLHYDAGMHVEAVDYFKIACELRPGAIEPKLGQALALEMLGNKTELRAVYEAVLKIETKNTYSHYKLGMLDYESKDYKSALSHFELINKLYPSDIDGLLMMGWTNVQLGNSDVSKSFFNRALCFSKNNESATKGLTAKPDAATAAKPKPASSAIIIKK